MFVDIVFCKLFPPHAKDIVAQKGDFGIEQIFVGNVKEC
jgi:hypothetical protein